MAKLTKAQARRRIEEIHQKVNALMAGGYLSTNHFVAFLNVIEKSRNRMK